MFDERTIKILDELGLTPGVIDGNAKHVFTTSHCDELAWALHRLTGHPVIVASNREHKHAGVLRDDDTVLDIDGAEPKDAWLAKCAYDSDQLLPESADYGLDSLPHDVTDTFARAVLQAASL